MVYLALLQRVVLTFLYLFSSLLLNLAYLKRLFLTCGTKQ
jgi:hypothetical protein